MCALARPGHFRGVATVVAKLFNMTVPDKAVFGLKDFQQLLVIKKLTGDLNINVEIIGVETVREADGLALSSRNNYLNPAEREAAAAIPASMVAARKLVGGGERDAGKVVEIVKKTVEVGGAAVVEYIVIRHPETLEEVVEISGQALLAVAVKIGKARLIDNCILEG
jgi:pantoate--beta-alanine ligase